MNKIAIYLNRHITGNVFDKDSILEAYSFDRSILKIKPRLVALPESTSDLRKLIRFVNQLAIKNYKLPLAVRGSGLSDSGADLTSGMVISTEKLNKVRELDAHDRLVHVQSGVTLGQLNSLLAPHGLFLPIKANPNETIGSLIANAPVDSYSGKYGGIMNYIDRVEVVLSNGDILQTSRLSRGKLNHIKKEDTLESEIYTEVEKILDENAEMIKTIKPSRAGYPGLKYIRRVNNRVFDLLPVFYASEGTLGIISEIILRLDVLPARPHRLFAIFNTFKAANEFMSFVKTLKPLELNFYDLNLIKAVEDYGKKPEILSKKFTDGFLVFVSFNDRSRLSRKKVKKCLDFLPKNAYVIPETLKNSDLFNDLPSMISSYLNDTGKGERVSLASNFSLPASELPNFLSELSALSSKLKKPLDFFGSYSTEIYSLRPDFKLDTLEDRRASMNFLKDLNALVLDHKGSLNGGFPEGRIRAIITNDDIPLKEKELYKKIKKVFDPNGILAPDIKTGVDTRSTVRALRSTYNPYIVE